MTYDFFFNQFDSGNRIIMDEICFYFKTDEDETEHYIGYLPYTYKNDHAKNEKPYWAGLCDINNGCDFSTAKDLLEAKIYNQKSFKERWDEIIICHIAGLSVEDWLNSL